MVSMAHPEVVQQKTGQNPSVAEVADDDHRNHGQRVIESPRWRAQKTKHGLIREPQRSHQRARSYPISNYVAESGHVMRPFGRARTNERSHQRAPSIYLPYPLVLTLDWINGRPIIGEARLIGFEAQRLSFGFLRTSP